MPLLAILNKQFGLSHGKCVKLLRMTFEELRIVRGTSVRSIARTGERCAPAHEQLREDLRSASEVAPYETSWRVGASNATSAHSTCFSKPSANRNRHSSRRRAVIKYNWAGASFRISPS